MHEEIEYIPSRGEKVVIVQSGRYSVAIRKRNSTLFKSEDIDADETQYSVVYGAKHYCTVKVKIGSAIKEIIVPTSALRPAFAG